MTLTKWDLTGDEQAPYKECIDTITARRGHCDMFAQGKLIALLKKHGAIKTVFVIERCMSNDWLKPDRWEALMELVEQYGIDRTLAAIKAMNRLENHSIATVEGILDGSIPTTRKNPNAPPEPARRKPDPIERPYPNKEHVYDARAADEWMRAKGVAFIHWPDYFDKSGRDQVYGDLVTLKPEYR